ncbi:MAG TPA: TetR/AcrR family transcriptional regulator C-terminal domain-containing protein [Pseudonocardiaceae bacterium]
MSSPDGTTQARPEPGRAVRRGRPRKGSEQLSRPAIVQATLTAIDALGVQAVSMRTVAATLRVDAKSLYNHVDGKDGLLDAVAEHLLGTITIPQRAGDTRQDLRAIAYAFRNSALAHPEAATLVLTRQLSSPTALAPTEAVLQVLGAAGFSAEESVSLLRMLVATLTGTLLRELQADATFGAIHSTADRQARLENSGLPAVARAAARIARFDRDAEFEFTVNAAIDAVLIRHPHRDRAGRAVRGTAPGGG